MASNLIFVSNRRTFKPFYNYPFDFDDLLQ